MTNAGKFITLQAISSKMSHIPLLKVKQWWKKVGYFPWLLVVSYLTIKSEILLKFGAVWTNKVKKKHYAMRQDNTIYTFLINVFICVLWWPFRENVPERFHHISSTNISFLSRAKWLHSTKMWRTVRIHWECSHRGGGSFFKIYEWVRCIWHKQLHPSCTTCRRTANLPGLAWQNEACLQWHHSNHLTKCIGWYNV